MKTGKVIRIDTNHVLIRWEDNSTSMTNFQDGNNKAFSAVFSSFQQEITPNTPTQTEHGDGIFLK